MMRHLRSVVLLRILTGLAAFGLWSATPLLAGEADLAIPDLKVGKFFGGTVSGHDLLFYGSFVIAGTLGISLYLRAQIKALPAHDSMLKVAEIIFETCKTYLLKQAQFLL
ncbi:MAG: sodium-translocating pyrophosphatase, partial [Planctomycetaceae bacterium]